MTRVQLLQHAPRLYLVSGEGSGRGRLSWVSGGGRNMLLFNDALDRFLFMVKYSKKDNESKNRL